MLNQLQYIYICNRISPLKNDPMPTMYKARGVLL